MKAWNVPQSIYIPLSLFSDVEPSWIWPVTTLRGQWPCTTKTYHLALNAAKYRKIITTGVVGGDASAPRKVLICWKSGRNPWKCEQTPWISGQKWRPTLFAFKKWSPTFAEKHMKTFFWRPHKENVFMIFVGEICRQTPHKNFSGKFGEIWAKMLRTPNNLPPPTPMTITNKPNKSCSKN